VTELQGLQLSMESSGSAAARSQESSSTTCDDADLAKQAKLDYPILSDQIFASPTVRPFAMSREDRRVRTSLIRHRC
jgi:hypothetical protein